MFLRALSTSLVLVGIAVASVNLRVQDSVKSQNPVFPTPTEVISAWVDLPLSTLIPCN